MSTSSTSQLSKTPISQQIHLGNAPPTLKPDNNSIPPTLENLKTLTEKVQNLAATTIHVAGEIFKNTIDELFTLIEEGNIEKAKKIISSFSYCMLSIQNEKGNTLLHTAVLSKQEKIASLLIEKLYSLQLNTQNKEGKTPLQVAIELNLEKTALSLIEKLETEQFYEHSHGQVLPPLHLAIQKKRISIALKIIEESIKNLENPGYKEPVFGDTPLHTLIRYDDPSNKPEEVEQQKKLAQVLLESVFLQEIMVKNSQGDSILKASLDANCLFLFIQILQRFHGNKPLKNLISFSGKFALDQSKAKTLSKTAQNYLHRLVELIFTNQEKGAKEYVEQTKNTAKLSPSYIGYICPQELDQCHAFCSHLIEKSSPLYNILNLEMLENSPPAPKLIQAVFSRKQEEALEIIERSSPQELQEECNGAISPLRVFIHLLHQQQTHCPEKNDDFIFEIKQVISLLIDKIDSSAFLERPCGDTLLDLLISYDLIEEFCKVIEKLSQTYEIKDLFIETFSGISVYYAFTTDLIPEFFQTSLTETPSKQVKINPSTLLSMQPTEDKEDYAFLEEFIRNWINHLMNALKTNQTSDQLSLIRITPSILLYGIQDKFRRNVVHKAILQKKLKVFEALNEKLSPEQLNTSNGQEQTPFHQLIYSKKPPEDIRELAFFFIENLSPEQLNKPNVTGLTPLQSILLKIKENRSETLKEIALKLTEKLQAKAFVKSSTLLTSSPLTLAFQLNLKRISLKIIEKVSLKDLFNLFDLLLKEYSRSFQKKQRDILYKIIDTLSIEQIQEKPFLNFTIEKNLLDIFCKLIEKITKRSALESLIQANSSYWDEAPKSSFHQQETLLFEKDQDPKKVPSLLHLALSKISNENTEQFALEVIDQSEPQKLCIKNAQGRFPLEIAILSGMTTNKVEAPLKIAQKLQGNQLLSAQETSTKINALHLLVNDFVKLQMGDYLQSLFPEWKNLMTNYHFFEMKDLISALVKKLSPEQIATADQNPILKILDPMIQNHLVFSFLQTVRKLNERYELKSFLKLKK